MRFFIGKGYNQNNFQEFPLRFCAVFSLEAGLVVVSVAGELGVRSVPVAHHVVSVHPVVSPVGAAVSIGLVPGVSVSLGISGPLVVEGSVLGVAGSVPVVVVHVVVHGKVVAPVSVGMVGLSISISLGFGLSISISLRFGISVSLGLGLSISLGL